MARFQNDTGSVLRVNDLMLQAGPGEKFDWPGYDPEVHGPVPGCTWLDAPKDDADAKGGKRAKPATGQDKEPSE